MVTIRFDRLVTETSQRLYGLSSLIDLIDEAHPRIWQRGKEALDQRAKDQDWEFGDYRVEAEFMEANFGYWLPKEEAYSIIVLLCSIVETQLLGYAQKVATQKGQAFDPNVFTTAILDRVAKYLKGIRGPDIKQNIRWQLLKDLQTIRNIIVHRAGKPNEREQAKIKQIRKRLSGVSLNENPYTMWHDPEISLTVRYCRFYAKEVEEFFRSQFKDIGLPVESALWPNIQSGLP